MRLECPAQITQGRKTNLPVYKVYGIDASLLLRTNQVAHRRHIGGVAGKCQAA